MCGRRVGEPRKVWPLWNAGRLVALVRVSIWRQISAVLDLGTAALTTGVLTLLARES